MQPLLEELMAACELTTYQVKDHINLLVCEDQTQGCLAGDHTGSRGQTVLEVVEQMRLFVSQFNENARKLVKSIKQIITKKPSKSKNAKNTDVLGQD